MEARITGAVLLVLCFSSMSFGARYRTHNFIINAPNKEFAKKVGDQAEVFRKELAEEWLGYELRQWEHPCPIHVIFKPAAEGVTQFQIIYTNQGRSYADHWDMTVAGTPERILDAVLPHEITHTIFATHFGRKLPRWADEGACTSVEHISELRKNHKMLIHFLTNNKGIPFNKMFRMKEYPRDMLPLYAQGYSLTRYLVEQKGRKHFVKYLGAGMSNENWNAATEKFYGYKDLSDLQVSWIAWVKKGCPKPQTEALVSTGGVNNQRQSNSSRPSAIASRDLGRNQVSNPVQSKNTHSQPPRSSGQLAAIQSKNQTASNPSFGSGSQLVRPPAIAQRNVRQNNSNQNNSNQAGWYVRKMQESGAQPGKSPTGAAEQVASNDVTVSVQPPSSNTGTRNSLFESDYRKSTSSDRSLVPYQQQNSRTRTSVIPPFQNNGMTRPTRMQRPSRLTQPNAGFQSSRSEPKIICTDGQCKIAR